MLFDDNAACTPSTYICNVLTSSGTYRPSKTLFFCRLIKSFKGVNERDAQDTSSAVDYALLHGFYRLQS